MKAYLSHGHDTATPAKRLSESLAHAGVAVLAREWSTALERSWSYPDKPFIPVVLAAVVCGLIPRSALESVSDLAGLRASEIYGQR